MGSQPGPEGPNLGGDAFSKKFRYKFFALVGSRRFLMRFYITMRRKEEGQDYNGIFKPFMML
jgi:hypothetical protein